MNSTTSWADWLQQNQLADLIEEPIGKWGGLRWEPAEVDRIASWEFLVELGSRIATQPLPLRAGTEDAALRSLTGLFATARQISRERVGCWHFTRITFAVLNGPVRRFTARWHHFHEKGSLQSADVRIAFRAELATLQAKLRLLATALGSLAECFLAHAFPQPPESAAVENRFAHPIPLATLRPGQDESWESVFAPEREAIRRRRTARGCGGPEQLSDGLGLALSGGGIRSATFAIGVLEVLERKGILQQVDYLSTVSGGGYLGSFVTSMFGASAVDARIFARADGREARGIRTLRNHSKYLVEGGVTAWRDVILLLLFGTITTLLFLGGPLVLLGVAAWATAQLGTSNAAFYLAAAVGATAYFAFLFGQQHRNASIQRAGISAAALAVLITLVALGRLVGILEPALALSLLIALGLTSVSVAAAAILSKNASRLAEALPLLLSLLGFCAAWTGVTYVFTALSAVETPLDWAAAAVLVGAAILVAIAVNTLVDLNTASPFEYYRSRLARTYLLVPSDFGAGVRPARSPKLSSSNPSHLAPYHLVNAAVNLPSSLSKELRGRRADLFTMSKDHCGSPSTGYFPTTEWESLNSQFDFASAIAISGAAAAPNMGARSSTGLRHTLAFLNFRLGQWLRVPQKAGLRRPPALEYYLREMFGAFDEKLPFVNVSDGGHIENLGVYELLRRHCKFILAVDGEADPQLSFDGLLTLVQLARIDLGVTIEPELADLRPSAEGAGRAHFEMFEIRYASGEIGALLYIKASLTGNESEVLRRYAAANPTFPHESTLNQLYSETQFEAYRELGEHIAADLFRKDLIGHWADGERATAWLQQLAKHLLSEARA